MTHKRPIVALAAILGVLALLWGVPRALDRVRADARASVAEQWRAVVEAREDSISRLQRLVAIKDAERLSLRERMSGWERRETPPQAVVRVDTVVVERTDTVLVAVDVDADGSLDRLATDSTRQALLLPPEDVQDCDLGLRLAGARVECRKPVLGHFWLSARAGGSSPALTPDLISPAVGASLTWRRTYRSPWAVRLEADAVEGRLRLMIERSIRLSF